jgi:hypothetical protein
MIIIPGIIITCITFPGVIIHEGAHKLFCDWTKTAVHQVCYFRFGNPAGFVIHDLPSNVWKHILIGVGPLFINSGIGLCIGLLAIPFEPIKVVNGALNWLAVSVAMHSFPSTGDAQSIWQAVWSKEAPIPAKCIGTPLVGLIYLGAIGSVFWLDLVYSCGVVFGIPALLEIV